MKSELDNIPGIGPKTRQELIEALKSVKRIKEATIAELTAIVGSSKAQKIQDYFDASRETSAN